jgi:L-iditol 2-dehydrogenase
VRVVRLHAPGDLQLHDEGPPAAGTGETLVRITDVGVCGSDLHWFEEGRIGDAQLTRPLVLGHEISGVVHEGPLAGTPVAVDPAVSCGRCRQCRAGRRNLCPTIRFAGHGAQDCGLCELLAWPTALLHPLPEALSTAVGAVLEPLGVAIHALDLAHLRTAASVAVVGCGPIGLLLVEAALASGATSVVAVEPLPHRRAAARHRGAVTVLSPDEVTRRLPGLEVDVANEAAGNDDAVEQAMALVRPGVASFSAESPPTIARRSRHPSPGGRDSPSPWSDE